MNNRGTFRKKKGFTIACNTVVRDKNLSLKAKGLYLLISSFITLDTLEITKSFLLNKCSEGEKAFCSAWNELKKKGYLKVHILPNDGKFKAEYELLDEPDLGAHTLYYSADGKITKTNKNKDTQPDNHHIPLLGSNGKSGDAKC